MGYPHKSWYSKFLHRHPVISLKRSEYLSASRAKVTEEHIQHWFEVTEDLLKEDNWFHILEEGNRVFNCDETAVWLNPDRGCVLTKKGEVAFSISPNSDKMNVTMLFTIRTDGEFLTPFVIHKGTRLPPLYRQLLQPGWKVRCRKMGWMMCEAFMYWIVYDFDDYLMRNNVPKPVILFMDNHVSHLSLECTEFCFTNRIILACLLPSITHLCQPLDVAINKAF